MQNSKKTGKLLKFIREDKDLTKLIDKQRWLADYLDLQWGNYKIEKDGSVTILPGYRILAKDISIGGELPVKFNDITNDVYIESCNLTTLKGLPNEIGGSLTFSHNRLVTLAWCPSYIGKSLDLTNNDLIDLTGCPSKINGVLSLGFNKLFNMKGGPEKVINDLSVYNNRLSTLAGFPSFIGGNLNIQQNPDITSFKDIHKHIKSLHGYLQCDTTSIKDSILGLFLIDGFKGVVEESNNTKKWEKIFNRHLQEKGKRGVYDCQIALIEAGLEEYAQL